MDKAAPEMPFVSDPLIAMAGRYAGGQWRLGERIRAAGGHPSAIVHGKIRALVVPNDWLDKPPRRQALKDAITHRVPVISLAELNKAIEQGEAYLTALIPRGISRLQLIEENWHRNPSEPMESLRHRTPLEAALDTMAAQQEQGRYRLKF